MVSADIVMTAGLRPVSGMHRETIVNERRRSRVAKRGNNEGSVYGRKAVSGSKKFSFHTGSQTTKKLASVTPTTTINAG